MLPEILGDESAPHYEALGIEKSLASLGVIGFRATPNRPLDLPGVDTCCQLIPKARANILRRMRIITIRVYNC